MALFISVSHSDGLEENQALNEEKQAIQENLGVNGKPGLGAKIRKISNKIGDIMTDWKTFASLGIVGGAIAVLPGSHVGGDNVVNDAQKAVWNKTGPTITKATIYLNEVLAGNIPTEHLLGQKDRKGAKVFAEIANEKGEIMPLTYSAMIQKLKNNDPTALDLIKKQYEGTQDEQDAVKDLIFYVSDKSGHFAWRNERLEGKPYFETVPYQGKDYNIIDIVNGLEAQDSTVIAMINSVIHTGNKDMAQMLLTVAAKQGYGMNAQNNFVKIDTTTPQGTEYRQFDKDGFARPTHDVNGNPIINDTASTSTTKQQPTGEPTEKAEIAKATLTPEQLQMQRMIAEQSAIFMKIQSLQDETKYNQAKVFIKEDGVSDQTKSHIAGLIVSFEATHYLYNNHYYDENTLVGMIYKESDKENRTEYQNMLRLIKSKNKPLVRIILQVVSEKNTAAMNTAIANAQNAEEVGKMIRAMLENKQD